MKSLGSREDYFSKNYLVTLYRSIRQKTFALQINVDDTKCLISIFSQEVCMKKIIVALAISLVLVLSLGAQAKVGPAVDKVIFDVRMQQDIARRRRRG